MRHRLRPPERRPPDHSRPGRPRRLPGVPARGRSRPALRRVRPGASVHVPPALARPRPDRDLLVPRRVAHARARLARRALRARDRRGRGTGRGDAVPRRVPLPPLRGQAPLRAPGVGRLRERDGLRAGLRASSSRDASGFRYPRENYLADMDDGFYSADYLRAWIRAAQVRAYLREAIGEDWWRRPETGVVPARPVRPGHAAVERGCRRAGSASTRSTPTRSSPSSPGAGCRTTGRSSLPPTLSVADGATPRGASQDDRPFAARSGRDAAGRRAALRGGEEAPLRDGLRAAVLRAAGSRGAARLRRQGVHGRQLPLRRGHDEGEGGRGRAVCRRRRRRARRGPERARAPVRARLATSATSSLRSCARCASRASTWGRESCS